MSTYMITQTRQDAIGVVQNNLIDKLPYKIINIKWFKFMPLSHLWELLRSIYIGLKLKDDDKVLSFNSKSIHTHIIPLFTKAKIYQFHYHFDGHIFGLHKTPYFSYNKLFKTNHTIFTNSEDKIIAETQYNCKNSFLIPLGVNHNIFYDDREKDPNLILYVGSFGHRKNIENILRGFAEAIKIKPELKLFIVNGSYGSYEMIEPSLKELAIKQSVIYKKDVPLLVLSVLYKNAAVFIFPTLKEGFGLPLVEAMSSGCKIVTSDLPTQREITRNKAIYCDPYDTLEIGKKIIEATELTHNLNDVGKFYSWHKTAKLIKEILNK